MQALQRAAQTVKIQSMKVLSSVGVFSLSMLIGITPSRKLILLFHLTNYSLNVNMYSNVRYFSCIIYFIAR